MKFLIAGRWLGCALALVCLATVPVLAHESQPVEGVVTLGPEGAYRLEIELDLTALATGRPPGHGAAAAQEELAAMSTVEFEAVVERLREVLARRLRVRIDGERAQPEVALPDLEGQALGRRAVLSGVAPAEAETLQVVPSRAFSALTLTLIRKGSEGEESATEDSVTLPRGEPGPLWSWQFGAGSEDP